MAVVAFIALVGGALLALVTLTVTGARRRGSHLLVAVVAGLFFPFTWVVWHVHDRDRYQTSPSR
ncbi:hypothetical protein [Nocardioides sp. W7]|uniref:hypothetical protein n=1 Tax=Nocardioides sp. W7 TaxID=2931390 RepID=UPI001FD4BC7E|nr:hypothetical protein [Nocardioides sp. W7]